MVLLKTKKAKKIITWTRAWITVIKILMSYRLCDRYRQWWKGKSLGDKPRLCRGSWWCNLSTCGRCNNTWLISLLQINRCFAFVQSSRDYGCRLYSSRYYDFRLNIWRLGGWQSRINMCLNLVRSSWWRCGTGMTKDFTFVTACRFPFISNCNSDWCRW